MYLHLGKFPYDFNLFDAGDWHIGSVLTHTSGIEEMIDLVASNPRKNKVILKGDLIEGITTKDKRYEEEMTVEGLRKPLDQANEVVRLLKPIRKQIILSMYGNHEATPSKEYGNIMRDICEKLEIPYGQYASKVHFNNKNDELMFKGYFHHGFGSITCREIDPRKRLHKMQQNLIRKMESLQGDCVLMSMSHHHQLFTCPPMRELYLADDTSKITQGYTESKQNDSYIPPAHRWFVAAGSFLKNYHPDGSGYAERAGYPPNILGYAVAKIRGGQVVDVLEVTDSKNIDL